MNTYELINFKENKHVVISIAFHLFILVLGFLAKEFKFIEGAKLKSDMASAVRLINASVRVDIVEMPKLTLKELKKLDTSIPEEASAPEASENKKQEQQDESKGESFEVEKKQKSFAELMKELSDRKIDKPKVKDAKGDGKGASDIKDQYSGKLNKLLLAGNKLSKGVAVVGGGAAVDGALLDSYLSRIPEFVKPNWKLPSFLHGKDLKCRIRIYLDAAGNVVQSEIWQSSGSEEYDKLALAAITKSSPFPRPKDELRSELASGGIILGFPL